MSTKEKSTKTGSLFVFFVCLFVLRLSLFLFFVLFLRSSFLALPVTLTFELRKVVGATEKGGESGEGVTLLTKKKWWLLSHWQSSKMAFARTFIYNDSAVVESWGNSKWIRVHRWGKIVVLVEEAGHVLRGSLHADSISNRVRKGRHVFIENVVWRALLATRLHSNQSRYGSITALNGLLKVTRVATMSQSS